MEFRRFCNPRTWVLFILCVLIETTGFAQKYYVSKEGDMFMNFSYKGVVSMANSEHVDVIFNRDKIVLWITVKGEDFRTGNRRIDNRFFRKNENVFVVKAEITQENIIYGEEEFLDFSLSGRIFNKQEGDAVTLIGRFGPSDKSDKESLSLYLYFATESKWMGSRFLKNSNFPIFNISLSTTLEPVGTDLKEVRSIEKL